MDFYDIHTHDASVSTEEGEQSHPYILNVYPLGFEDAKDAPFNCLFSCGVHPWYSDNATPQLNFLEEIATDSRIVAIGETGLDRLKGPELTIQRSVFERQIELSERLQKPLIVHCVKAWEELFVLHKKYMPKQVWIIHGYRGKPDLTRRLLKCGFMFSIGDKYNKDSLKEIPQDRMFCETDTSDIDIVSVYENIAEDLEMPIAELQKNIEQNVMKIFPQLIPINA